MYTNKQILSAVLTKWATPAITQFVGDKFSGLPFVANIEAKIKSTGWVSPMWSATKELSPIMNGLSSKLIEPLLTQYLEKTGLPDEAIPSIAHTVVDDAIKNGGLKLFEEKIEFEKEDLEELKKLLMYNLPISEETAYEVITEKP